MLRRGRLIFDITDMVRFAHENWQVTGIARVSLTLAFQAYSLSPERVKIGYFDVVTQSYRVLQDPSLLADAGNLRAHLKRSATYIKPLKIWKHRKHSLGLSYHRLQRWLTLSAVQLKRRIGHHQYTEPKLSFEPGDRLVCLGGGWGALDAHDYLRHAMASASGRPELIALIHDLIPFFAPAKTGSVDTKLFNHWLRQLIALDASFLFYSKSTEQDFKSWCSRQCIRRPGARRFRLGDELIVPADGVIRPTISAFKGKNYILCVGSLGGRKNGARLIAALDMQRGEGTDRCMPDLVLAGSTTREELATLLGGEASLNNIHFVDKPSDAELGFLYRHCRFTVFPSLYEGWGLPIGESLWHGKLCATSNCSSMPEVGEADCDYFNPHDTADIARALKPLLFDDTYLARRSQSLNRDRLRSWRTSALELLHALDEEPLQFEPQSETEQLQMPLRTQPAEAGDCATI